MKNDIKILLACFVFILMSFNIKNKRIPFCGFGKNGYYGYQKASYITKIAKIGDGSGLPEVVETIEGKLGFKVAISVYLAKAEDNCWATTAEGGKRLLIADEDFLQTVNSMSGTKWAAISVIAHEIGHHIAGFGWHDSQLDDELDADYWSGYILNKLGSSKNAATKCIMKFGTEENTSDHPNKYSRSHIIEVGWDDAANGTVNYDHCQSCRP